MRAQPHAYVFLESIGLRSGRQSVTPLQQEATGPGAGALEHNAHESVDELLEHDLARDCLRSLGRRYEVELHAAVERWRGQETPTLLRSSGARAQLRKVLLELLDLTAGAPARIGCVRGFERALRGCRRPTTQEIAGRELARQRLVLNKTMLAR